MLSSLHLRLSVSLCGLLAALLLPLTTEAAARSFSGYIWSETIGWISLSGGNYGLTEDGGTIRGYAWSPHIGWVTAEPALLAGCPAAPCSARIDNSGKLQGWLKAIAGGTEGSGGWSGWIRLRGSVSGGGTYGPVAGPNGRFSGFAWGSTVVGWVDFSYAFLPPPTPPSSAPAATAACVGTPPSLTLTWPTVTDANRYSISITALTTGITTNYTNTTAPLTIPNIAWGEQRWQIAACNTAGCGPNTTQTTTCAAPSPVVTLNANASLLAREESPKLSWEVSAPYPVQCSLTGGKINTSFDYPTGGGSMSAATPYVAPPISTAVSYTLVCRPSDPAIPATPGTDAVKVDVVPEASET